MKASLAVIATALLSCVCSSGKGSKGALPMDPVVRSSAESFSIDKARADLDLAELTRAPHILGSSRQQEITTWLMGRITELGVTGIKESFSATVPNPAALDPLAGPVNSTVVKDGTNVYATGVLKPDAPCVVALASHYDTKFVAGIDYLGANDSGSSSALLLQILAYLKSQMGKIDVTCDVIGIWFDGEEATLAGWTDGERIHPAKIQDNTYGSRFAAGRTTACAFEGRKARCLPADLGGRPLVALVLLDMVGSPGLLLTREGHSSDSLLDLAVQGADAMGYGQLFSERVSSVEDDHLPYLRTGIAALDLIDFNHLDVWHKAGDEASAIAPESLKIAGHVALYVALSTARTPKVFLASAEE